MINSTNITFATLLLATVALVAAAVIVVFLRPHSHHK